MAEAIRRWDSIVILTTLLSFPPPRGNPVGGVEKINFAVIPAHAGIQGYYDNVTLEITSLNAD